MFLGLCWSHILSVKDQIINILGFAGHMRSQFHLLSFLLQPFKNIKIILSSRAIQKPARFGTGQDGVFIVLFTRRKLITVITTPVKIGLWHGVPGWLSWLGVQLQLRSWSYGSGSWVRALHGSFCCQSRIPFGSSVSLSLSLSLSFSLSLCLCPSPARSVSLSLSLSSPQK